MNRFSLKLLLALALMSVLASGSTAQVIYPNPNFCSFADTLFASTFDGAPLPIGSIIQAYDQSGTYCGIDTVVLDGGSGNPKFGYFSVYGDDSQTSGLDEGAETGEQLVFKINGRTATVIAGDDTWNNQELKSVSLAATSTAIGMVAIKYPADTLILPGDTVQFEMQVQNVGDGLDFYGVKLEMSIPGGPGPFDWEALPPDTMVYADADEIVSVFFSVRTPTFHADTAVAVTYTVYSNLDSTVTVGGTVNLYRTLTDVDEGDIASLPGAFTLEQNYPNPFNPATTIAYNLAVGSPVRLEIIDMLGRTVDIRDLGWISAGPGQFVYDAAELSSGVYLYRISTATGAQSRKMMLIK